MLCGEMRVTQGHRDGLMAHQFLNGAKLDAGHDQPTREGVPQIVPVEIFDSGLDQSRYKDSAHEIVRIDRRGAHGACKYPLTRPPRALSLQSFADDRVDRHMPDLAVFRARNRDDAADDVNVLPFEVELLCLSQSGVQCDHGIAANSRDSSSSPRNLTRWLFSRNIFTERTGLVSAR